MNQSDLEDALVNTLLLTTEKSKQILEAMKGDFIRLGCKTFWRWYIWTFSTKRADLTLTADALSYDCPDDCDAVIGIQRQTTDNYGWDLIGTPTHVFDLNFPFPDSHATDDVVYYKVENDAGTKKIYGFPVSDNSDASKIIYKKAYDLTHFMSVVPDDYEPFVLACCLHSAGQYPYPQLKYMMQDAVKKDKLSQARKLSRIGASSITPVPSISSYQYILRLPYEWN